MYRVAVIGAGAVGACVAYYLARAGAAVILVDAGHPGALTTSASFAWINASAKAGDRAYFDLNAEGIREYERLVADLGGASWFHQTGHLRWDYSDEHALTAAVEQVRARGYPAEAWGVDRARRLLEPHLAFAPACGLVALFSSEGWVDGPRMAQALADAAVRSGATTAFGTAVSGIEVADGAVAAVQLASGETFAVDSVVNAAGPGAAVVAALVGRVLPLEHRPGLAVRVEMSRDLVRRVVHAPGIAVRPDGAGRAFLLARGADPRAAGVGPTAEDVVRLGAGVVPGLAGAIVTDARTGQRPVPVDGFPAIGEASEPGGYYEAVTHSGITLAPIIGRMLADEIIDGRIDPLASNFRASRF